MLGEDFNFDGISSVTHGVKIIRIGSSGFLNEQVIGDASITEVEHPADFKPHLQKVERGIMEFSLQLALLNENGVTGEWTETKRQDISNWLLHNEYKPLIVMDRPEVVYYVIASSNISLNTMGGKGYLEISFRTNSPYAWKKERVITVPGSSTSSSTVTIPIDRALAVDKLFPIIELERIGASASIIQVWRTGLSAGDLIGIMNSLIPSVNKIRINTKYRSITDQETGESLYQYKGVTGFQFLSLVPGSNVLFIPKGWKAKIYINEPIKY